MSFHILVVCTGNVCRSPFAHGLLAAGLPGAATVSSGGFHPPVGSAMDPRTEQALIERNAKLPGFCATKLTEAEMGAAELILTAETWQREAVIAKVPTALRRTFTILEFAALTPLIDLSNGPTAGVRQAARLRGKAPARLDIVDPVDSDDAAYQQVLTQITAAVDEIITSLGGSTRTASS